MTPTLTTIGAGLFLVLHGVVHIWYVALSQGVVEIEDQMGWNGHSWLLSALLPTGTILSIASALYIIAAAGFAAGAIGYVFDAQWATRVLVGAAVVSTLTLVAMWDGRPDLLVEKGLLGVLINAGIVAILLSR